jgi:alpha-1,3-rhamnosyl/mannosyltransferase
VIVIDKDIERLNPQGGIATIWREVTPHLPKWFREKTTPNIWLSTYYGRSQPGYKSVVMVYDFIADIYPHLRNQADIQWKWEAIEQADLILTISPWVDDELRRLSALKGVKAARSVVVPMGTSFTKRTADKVYRTMANYQIEGKYLIVVGRRFWYKNVRTLYQAWPFVKDAKDITIVCVGGEQPSREEIEFSRENKWRWLNHVPSSDLEALLTGAAGLVYPSLYEGFGLPALDAMACGTPVICNPRTGLSFAAGLSLPIWPHRPKTLASRINLLDDGDLTFATNPMTWAKQWTWAKTAQEIGEALRGLE